MVNAATPIGHSRLSPSKAAQWLACPGSVAMQAVFPDNGSSEAAEEGTACHWMAAEVLLGRGGSEFIGRTAPNGVVITAEMKAAAVVYVAAIKSMVPELAVLQVEDHVQIPYIHKDCHGTPDCWYFNPTTMTMYIWDLKYGFTLVDERENWQLLCYAAAKFKGTEHIDFNKVRVVLTIVQPRAYHTAGAVRSWHLTGAELKPYADRLQNAAAIALCPNPPCQAGEQCHYCSARHACATAQQAALWACDYIGQAVPEALTPEALAMELRTLQRASAAIKYRLAGIESSAIATISSGGSIPGFTTENGAGREGWNIPATEVFAIGDMMGIDLRSEVKPVTPVQAKQKGFSEDLVKAYSSKGVGALRLIESTDTLAARVFGGGA